MSTGKARKSCRYEGEQTGPEQRQYQLSCGKINLQEEYVMKPSARKIISLGVVCALTASMAAAGTGCKGNTNGSVSAKAAQSGTVSSAENLPTGQNLHVWTYMQTETPTLKEYAAKWAKKTGNTVNLIYQTAPMQQFAQAAHSSSGPDVVYGIPNDNVATFAAANLVKEVPAGTIQESDFTPASVSACKVNGKTCGVPIAIESIALFYNTDKVPTVPETFEELISKAQQSSVLLGTPA
jgi:arabinogalactan oligomer/maltooligosaccharide transport system substrate-binding protein